MGGTSIAQVINIIVAPIVTRIYSPTLFGEYALYLAIVNLIVIVSTLKFEIAIFLPTEEGNAINVLAITLFFVCCFTIISGIIIFFTIYFDSYLPSNLTRHLWLKLIPLLVFFQGVSSSLKSWISRQGKYRFISMGLISRILLTNIIFVIFGYAYVLQTGLIYGSIIGQMTEMLLYAFVILRSDKRSFLLINIEQMKIMFRRYINFPKYSLPAETLNSFTTQNPVFLLSSFYSPIIVGNYSLVQRVLGVPLKLFASSTLEVFKKKASNDKQTFGKFDSIFLKTFLMLFLTGLIPAILFWFFLPELFPIIFGKEWVTAGQYARYLSIMFLFQFSISPLGFSLYISEKQNYELYWQILLIIFTSFGLIIGIYLNKPEMSIMLFSITYSIMYLLYFYWGWKFSKDNSIE